MGRNSFKTTTPVVDPGDGKKVDLRAQFAESKKNPSQSLSFAFSSSSFSLSSKDSRNEQRVQKSLRSVIQKAPTTTTRRKSDGMITQQQQPKGRRSSAPSVFVNPPTFALARGKKEGSVRQTMGVPMISMADNAKTGKKKNKVGTVGYKVNKTAAMGGGCGVACKPASVRGGMFVSPPAMSAVTSGGTSRARKTLGVPMV